MRDLDKLLTSRGNPTPQRPLRADFTNTTISYIKAHPRPAGLRARIKENLKMKLNKPATAFAAAAITLAIGGTAYAAFNWPTITSVFRSETKLPSGNRIVAIDTENCQYFGKPEAGKEDKSNLYYEIKKDSTLTNDEAIMMIKGICEENRNNAVLNPMLEQLSKSHTGMNILGSQALLVKRIDGTKLTVTLDPQYDPAVHYGGEVTYTLTNQTQAYDGTNLTKLSALKTGDTVMMIFNDRHAVGSEGDINDPNHYDDPDLLDVLTIVRVPALTGSPDAFYKNLGKAFVRTEPCATGPAGFCRAYEFDQQN